MNQSMQSRLQSGGFFATMTNNAINGEVYTILLESIKALVYEVYTSAVKSQDKGKKPLVFIMSVLCIKN